MHVSGSGLVVKLGTALLLVLGIGVFDDDVGLGVVVEEELGAALLVLDDDVGLGVVVEEELGAALLVLDDDVGLGVVVEHV